jgi:hypothetical protein
LFTLSINPCRTALLAEFSGMLRHADLVQTESAMRAQEKAGPLGRILDFSNVTVVAIPPEKLAERAAQHPALPANAPPHIHVAPTDYLFGLCRLYAARAGAPDSSVVRSRADAYDALKLVSPVFHPLELVQRTR